MKESLDVLKQELRDLVEIVRKSTGKTQEELAISMDYGGTYISELLSPTGKPNRKFINKFKKDFSDYLAKPSNSGLRKKAPTVSDVDAFLISNQVKQEAIMQTMLEFLAEIGAPQLKMPVTKVLSDLQKAVLNREEELREAAKKAIS